MPVLVALSFLPINGFGVPHKEVSVQEEVHYCNRWSNEIHPDIVYRLKKLVLNEAANWCDPEEPLLQSEWTLRCILTSSTVAGDTYEAKASALFTCVEADTSVSPMAD
jgi:hypothetical protein